MRYVTKRTYATACEPGDHSRVPGDQSRVTRRTYATACEYIYRARALTHVLRTADWMVCLIADGRASSTRAVADLLWLDNAGVSCCFGASDRLERVCRAATCVRSSAGSERRLSVVGLFPLPFSWAYFMLWCYKFVLGPGLLFCRGFRMPTGQ